jgi:hypothetical protein
MLQPSILNGVYRAMTALDTERFEHPADRTAMRTPLVCRNSASQAELEVHHTGRSYNADMCRVTPDAAPMPVPTRYALLREA